MKWYEFWRDTRHKWHQAVGLPAQKLKFHIHEKLAHYANAAVDIEFEFPFGFKEIEGIHSRTAFDLTEHQKLSRKSCNTSTMTLARMGSLMAIMYPMW